MAWIVAVALGTFIAIAVALREPLLAQLISPHLWNSQTAAYDSENHGWIYFGGLLVQEPILLIAGIAGVVATLSRPRELYGARLIPLLWLGISVITFAYHRPVWPHHLPMILVPLAWLGGSAVAIGLAWLRAVGARSRYRNAVAAGFRGSAQTMIRVSPQILARSGVVMTRLTSL